MRPGRVARILAAAIACLVCVTWLESPLRPSATRRLQMLAIAPQFWGYFAYPRQDRVQAFRWREGAWIQADAPLGAPGNLFGLQRAAVHHSSEFTTLLRQVGSRWSETLLRPDQLPDTSAPGLAVTNVARHPRLCGDVLLLSRTPVPWAWVKVSSTVELPARYVRLSIQC